jgi:hypothetical protein
MKKLLLAVIAMLMVITLAGCGNGGGSDKPAEKNKQEYYATYFDNHELVKDPFMISVNYSDMTDMIMEIGAKGEMFTCRMAFEGRSLEMIGNDKALYMKVTLPDQPGEWVYTETEDAESMQPVTAEEMTGSFDDLKDVTYKETVTENGKEYDIITVTVKGEDGEEDFPAEIWVCNDKVERIVYEEASFDENGNDIVSKVTMNILDGSSIALPKEAENAAKASEEDLMMQLFAFLFSGMDFEDE